MTPFHNDAENPESDSLKPKPPVSRTHQERLQQWIDHEEWDVFSGQLDIEQDKEFCLALLANENIFAIAESGDPDDTEQSSVDAKRRPNIGHRFSNPRFLGIGSFGIVLAVWDDELRMELAIKLMRPSRMASPEIRRRFLKEARAAATLSHPGIVRVFELGHIQRIPYMTTSLIEGGSLERTGFRPTKGRWLANKPHG
jgi:hypothetical protein